MRDLKTILPAIALCLAAIAVTFAFLNFRIYWMTDAEIHRHLPAGFLTHQVLYSVGASLCLIAISYSLSRIRDEQYEDLKHAANDRHARELDFHQKAINTHTIVSVTSPDCIFLEVNDNFVDVFGYSSKELIGKSQAMLYAHRHLDPAFQAINETVAEGRVWSGEEKMRSKSGEIVYVHTTVIPQHNEAGQHVRNVTMRTDVTAARKAEADHFLTMMLEELQDEVYIYDAETLKITYVNRSAQARCGWTPSEARKSSITDTAPNFDERMFRAHVAPLITEKVPVVTIEAMHPKGPVEIATRLMTGLDDKKLFVSVLRDISWRKQVEKAKMESVSVVSHELRTPLTSIKGSLRLLQSGVLGELNPKVKSIIDIASRNSDRLLMVVNDILDLEKIQANKMDFEMEPLDLCSLVTEAVEINQGFADEHGVTFHTMLPEEPAMIRGDADRLMQVMTNLMSNAVKFSPTDGIVTLTVRQNAGYWRLSIRDKGPGIPEKARSTLFKSFAQTTPIDGRKREGTGLGLVIVKTILKFHSSVIDFRSEVGVGTEFFFDVPAHVESAAKRPRLAMVKES